MRTPALCGLLLAAVLALLPISGQGQCANWDASGILHVRQQGQRFSIYLALEQKGGWISGTAILFVPRDDGGQNRLEGAVDGTIADDHFTMKVLWDNDQTGFYDARILPTGRLEGDGWEKNTPKVRLAWHSEEVLKCRRPPVSSKALSPPKPPPPPLKATAKQKRVNLPRRQSLRISPRAR